jgi:hypothetical protein
MLVKLVFEDGSELPFHMIGVVARCLPHLDGADVRVELSYYTEDLIEYQNMISKLDPAGEDPWLLEDLQRLKEAKNG